MVIVWDASSGAIVRTLVGHDGEVDSVEYSRDGKIIVSGGKDKTIKTYDAATGEPRQTITGHTGRVESLAISADGMLLATGGGGGDTSVRIWTNWKQEPSK